MIQKDFFPDLEKLKAQNQYLDAIEKNDVIKLRELYAKYSGKVPSNRTFGCKCVNIMLFFYCIDVEDEFLFRAISIFVVVAICSVWLPNQYNVVKLRQRFKHNSGTQKQKHYLLISRKNRQIIEIHFLNNFSTLLISTFFLLLQPKVQQHLKHQNTADHKLNQIHLYPHKRRRPQVPLPVIQHPRKIHRQIIV